MIKLNPAPNLTPGTVTGRFAPSPTGDLHMGSLMAAVASFLSAKKTGGRWMLRIEDVDTPREVIGAADRILYDIERFGMEWDGPIWYQSKRHERYRMILDRLIADGLVYPCSCSRKEIRSAGLSGVDGYRYHGHCRTGVVSETKAQAWRIKVPDENVEFADAIQGVISQNIAHEVGDFVLLRADGCWAYQLAVVVDDAEQGVSQVMRGADLLDSTPRQIWLQRTLGYPLPEYMHIPVLNNEAGEKLSKQTLAPRLRNGMEAEQLWQALLLLWQNPPADLRKASLQDIWAWAMENWSVLDMPQKKGFSVTIDQNLGYRFLDSGN